MLRITRAAQLAGRRPEEVRLVAVSKTVGPALVRQAWAGGQRVFGESRVQEAKAKAGALSDLDIEWHLVGHLQKNKAKAAVGLFELIHSVDSVALLEALDSHARQLGKVQRVLLQVDLAGEAAKYGLPPAELGAVLAVAEGMKDVAVEGLMTIPPYFEDPERSRPYYKRLAALAREHGLRELSMGMTGDFEVAVAEGATWVRVGSAIFGERQR